MPKVLKLKEINFLNKSLISPLKEYEKFYLLITKIAAPKGTAIKANYIYLFFDTIIRKFSIFFLRKIVGHKGKIIKRYIIKIIIK